MKLSVWKGEGKVKMCDEERSDGQYVYRNFSINNIFYKLKKRVSIIFIRKYKQFNLFNTILCKRIKRKYKR